MLPDTVVKLYRTDTTLDQSQKAWVNTFQKRHYPPYCTLYEKKPKNLQSVGWNKNQIQKITHSITIINYTGVPRLAVHLGDAELSISIEY